MLQTRLMLLREFGVTAPVVVGCMLGFLDLMGLVLRVALVELLYPTHLITQPRGMPLRRLTPTLRGLGSLC